MDRRFKIQIWSVVLAALTIALLIGGSVWKLSATVATIATRQEHDEARITKLESDGSPLVQRHVADDDRRFGDLKERFDSLEKALRDVPADVRWIKETLKKDKQP